MTAEAAPSPPTSYSALQKAAHWLVVALCLLQIPTAAAIGRSHEAHNHGLPPAPLDLLLHEVHTVSGLAIFGLVALRLSLRLRFGPFLAEEGSRWMRRAAAANHAALYAVLLALPVTGIGARYVDFGRIGPVHVALTRALLLLVTIHLAAVLWHTARRDGVLSRMLPGRRQG